MENRELHRIVSTAIIIKDGKYLIIKRSPTKKVFPGKWTVPGGGLETDDYINMSKTTKDHWYFAIEKSLRREIKEEVGLEVKKLNYLLDLAFIRPDGIPVITLSYWGYYKSGKVKLDEDSVDFKWVILKEAKNYDLIAGIWEEIEMVDKILRKGNNGRIEYRKKQTTIKPRL
ncbi:NUDIX domain-containing protein [Patescibacteria group bacterium]|nr:NUDIX domain-containing protein [Patescibacteria group bacterium]